MMIIEIFIMIVTFGQMILIMEDLMVHIMFLLNQVFITFFKNNSPKDNFYSYLSSDYHSNERGRENYAGHRNPKPKDTHTFSFSAIKTNTENKNQSK